MTGPEPRAGHGSTEGASLEGADDPQLVAAFRAGRREAFDEIVRRHQRGVYQLCLRFVHNHEDATDLAQDVFVRAFKGLRKFKGDAALGTWLYRIAVNVSLNRVGARSQTQVSIDAAEDLPGRSASALDHMLEGERAEAVRRAVDQLPAKQRATVILRIYQDCSHEEIAAALGGTVGASKANLFHALANLRRLLGRT